MSIFHLLLLFLSRKKVNGVLTPDPVKQVFHLRIPKLALVFDFFFFGEVFDAEDGLVGNFRFFDAEFEKFFFGGVEPVETDQFGFFSLEHFGFVDRFIPHKAENTVTLIDLFCKPFL